MYFLWIEMQDVWRLMCWCEPIARLVDYSIESQTYKVLDHVLWGAFLYSLLLESV